MKHTDEIDATILHSIACGVTNFTSISGQCGKLVRAIGEMTGRPPYRVLDSRLQALRKAGKIVYAKGSWAISKGDAA